MSTPPPVPKRNLTPGVKRSPFTPRRIKRACLILAAAGIVLVVYYFLNPLTSGLAPKCLIKTLTGIDCPGCGSQRMFHALALGDFAGAWNANPFLICFIPILGWWVWIDLDTSTYPRAAHIINSHAFIFSVLIIIIIWTVIRNFLSL